MGDTYGQLDKSGGESAMGGFLVSGFRFWVKFQGMWFKGCGSGSSDLRFKVRGSHWGLKV